MGDRFVTGHRLANALLRFGAKFQVPAPDTSDRARRRSSAKLTIPNPTTPVYDCHEVYDSPLPTPDQRRQQRRPTPRSPSSQQAHQPPISTSEPGSTPASHRRLRRTPNFSATPSPRPEQQQTHQTRQPLGRVTVALGPGGRYILADAKPKVRQRPARQLSQDNLSGDSLATSSHLPSLHSRPSHASLDPDRIEPHPVVRISKHTHSAILYALEESLRGPKDISDDPVELYSQMADLMGGRGPPTTNGNGSASARATTARAAVGSPSGIRGPRMIMQERAAREARQREERERLERQHAEEEAQLRDEAVQREAERRAAAAGAGTSSAGAIHTGADPSASRRSAQPAQPTSGRATTDNGARTAGPSRVPSSAQAQASQTTRHGRTTSGPAQGGPGVSSGPAAAGPSGTQPQPGEFSTAIGRGRNSFPHAFERWETLSAHWEGLTSFWIRRLEQSSQEISNDPVSQQLSRQVTDLSSAGANLFHAVVELQRLRASSERKFQRWFFETRSELERNQEVTAMLESALEEERRNRAEAIQEAVEHEQGSSKIQKQLAEMRKELTISKEEARRAWEELGRREQEERDRTTSLQLGQPTIVGGVQVVPMTQSVSRGNSQPDPRYAQPESSDYAQSPTSRMSRPEQTPAPAVQPVATSAGSNPAFQTPSAVHHQPSYGSEGTYSEEEFETPATQPGVYQPTGSAPQQPRYSSAPDYSGTGYSAPGWEEMQPRHHHPTRLSDVLEEEEERSRTSASHSQVSRRH
ncbi:Uu.00g116960.m01.CDS01 [Anthostomella pinea]|uniref:Uu.00g116960.m01.CDS01 n=1 Tax=Anthostomella pinea TaxID=933095 RepID=A0AAI8VG64_9PEZI|nr:Uu.00g116960.m01.CDS01 [Anthostomella pinea]